MKKNRITTAVLAGATALGALAFAPPEEGPCAVDDRGTADDTSDDAELCQVARYISCDDAQGGKVHLYAAGNGGLDHAQMTEERPTTSFTAGGGCGQAENSTARGVTQDNIHDISFVGTLEGNIDSLAVELHDFDAREARGDGTIELGIRVSIDGGSPFGFETIELSTGDTIQAPRMVNVQAKVTASSTGLTDAYQFTILGIGDHLDTIAAGSGDFHQIQITVDTSREIGGHAFVWGAEEVPAGILTNPTDIIGTPVFATG